jgi:hypothetical protein
MEEMRKSCFVGKPERKRPLGRPRSSWKDNIDMDLWEIVCKFVDWMHLAQDSEHSNEPSCSMKGRKFLD